MSASTMKIAVIPGDGIGKEVMPEGVRVLEAATSKYGFDIEFTDFEFSSCEYYQTHSKMLPDDWKEQVAKHDVIFFWCGRVARHGAGPRFAMGFVDPVPA